MGQMSMCWLPSRRSRFTLRSSQGDMGRPPVGTPERLMVVDEPAAAQAPPLSNGAAQQALPRQRAQSDPVRSFQGAGNL